MSSQVFFEPRTYNEATLADDDQKWQMAMTDQCNSLMKLKT